MKPMTLTPAILMAATLFAATAAHAQSATARSAWPPGPTGEATAYPPGPSAQAYPPGPSGQAAAQTNNVNVVNVPTVAIGNDVTVKEQVKEPVQYQATLDLAPNFTFVNDHQYDVPTGKRLLLENVNVACSAKIAQPVEVALYTPALGYPMANFIPAGTMPWGAGSLSVQLFPVHLLVDDSVKLSALRYSGSGFATCTVTLLGYLIPLP